MAIIPTTTINPSSCPERVFNYLDLADVDEIEGEIVSFQQRKGKDIKGGKIPFKGGDVIFARIEPSIFNRKYALVPEEIETGVGSTEFYVARPRKGVSGIYLHWALRGEWVAEQLNPGILRGSTGRRRLSRDDFSQLLIPDASTEEQIPLERIIFNSRKERREHLELADAVITKADESIVKMLYETSPFESTDNPSNSEQLELVELPNALR